MGGKWVSREFCSWGGGGGQVIHTEAFFSVSVLLCVLSLDDGQDEGHETTAGRSRGGDIKRKVSQEKGT